MTSVSNLSVITAANFQRECYVGSMRLAEMSATIGKRFLAFQPPSMPADKQAKQITNSGSEGPCKVFMIGEDLLDLGALDTVADGQPQSTVSCRLGTRSFIHQWEKSGALEGNIDFADYRFSAYLTLSQIVTEIATFYHKELAVVRASGGRIPHYLVIVWTGTELKSKITKIRSQGSIRPNHHTALYDDHYPARDNAKWNSAQTAALQLGELVRDFMGIILLSTGCADVWDLDALGMNAQIDRTRRGEIPTIIMLGRFLR